MPQLNTGASKETNPDRMVFPGTNDSKNTYAPIDLTGKNYQIFGNGDKENDGTLLNKIQYLESPAICDSSVPSVNISDKTNLDYKIFDDGNVWISPLHFNCESGIFGDFFTYMDEMFSEFWQVVYSDLEIAQVKVLDKIIGGKDPAITDGESSKTKVEPETPRRKRVQFSKDVEVKFFETRKKVEETGEICAFSMEDYERDSLIERNKKKTWRKMIFRRVRKFFSCLNI